DDELFDDEQPNDDLDELDAEDEREEDSDQIGDCENDSRDPDSSSKPINANNNKKSGDRPSSKSQTGSNNSSHSDTPSTPRQFISYLAVTPVDEDEELTPDGLSQEERMRIESLAIDAILLMEPSLRRTPPGNAGYDLFDEVHLGH